MKGRCVVVSGAPAGTLDVDLRQDDFVIAADAGFRLCEQTGITPDLLVADFDSLGPDARGQVHCEVAELPCAKDDTDTLAALRIGLERGFREFCVANALGGDVGHTLANMQGLLFLREHGADGVLCGCGQQVACVVPQDGMRRFAAKPGMRVSVFAAAGDAEDVTERGLRWELDKDALSASFPLGVSNEALGHEIEVSVGRGALWVVLG